MNASVDPPITPAALRQHLLTFSSGLVAHGDIPLELVQHDNPLLQQKMKPRHLQMIAVGGSIGTGLFVSVTLPVPAPTPPSSSRSGTNVRV